MAHTPDIVVTETGPKYVSQAVGGGHSLVADLPAAEGGGGAGLPPFGLVLTGLGACTNMTVRLYADRKGWPLERIATYVAMAADNTIRREIELVGTLDAEQRQRLLAIAEHCLVHKFLAAGTKITTTFRS